MCIQVNLDITRPLLRQKKLNIGLPTPVWLWLSYEKLFNFCFCCGILGHTHKDCEDWKEAKELYEFDGFPYDKWLQAGPRANGEGSGPKKRIAASYPQSGSATTSSQKATSLTTT